MGYADERSAIISFFNANWSMTPWLVENDIKEQPDDDAWVRLTIRNGEANQVTLGTNGYHRFPGTIICQVFVPKNKGTKQSSEIADALVSLFANWQHSAVKVMSPYCVTVGVVQDFHQVNVMVPFYRNEQLSS